jgi:hypothetical protein
MLDLAHINFFINHLIYVNYSSSQYKTKVLQYEYVNCDFQIIL